MPGEAEGPNLEVGPRGLVRRIRGQAPLRRTPPDAPPGEDEAENFLCLEDSQPRGPGWVGLGSGDALAGCIVFKTMEGTDEPAPLMRPPAAGPRSEPRCGQNDSATQTRPFSSHQATMLSPIQVFWISLAFSTS